MRRDILNELRIMLLQIAERQVAPDITVVELSGKLALGRESQRIESLVDELVEKGTQRLIVDMTAVHYIDSAGVGMVALAAGKMKETGGKLAVVASEGRVLQLLKLTQMNTIVNVCPTVAEAAGHV
jgi:anti-sigma B factor antagonist